MNKNNFLKIKKLLKFVYNNPYSDFYRTKYKKAGFNPLTDFKSIKDIKKIPFLTKKELLNANFSKLLFVNKKDVLCVKSTSGTTGKPLYIFYSKLDGINKWILKKDLGRVLVLVDPINIYYLSLDITNNGFLPLNGNIHNLPATVRMAADLQINTVYSSPTLIIILNDYLKDYPIVKKSLKYFYLFGEIINHRKKKLLQKLYPGVTIILSYGTIETATIGFQCKYLVKRGNQIYYHPRFDWVHIEIVNPDTEEEVKPGEKGEIVITNFYLRGTPIIRYKIGDLVSLKEEKNCSCGFPGPLLQVWGRANYDYVKAGGFELRREFLEKIIDNSKSFLKDSFEAHIYENFENNKPKIRIELNLSLKKGVQESIFLKQRVEKELLETWQISSKLKLKKAIEAGLFEPIKINFIGLPASFKSKKTLILHQL